MVFIHLAHLGNLGPGAYGIPAPPDGPEASSLDVILCPGLAFTRDGRRLGQGGGYYDRILPRFPQARTIGIAFPCQIVDDLPWESHDRRMDAILTPRPES
jgi:5-formyltetrahydrofolate cyclo-ligase